MEGADDIAINAVIWKLEEAGFLSSEPKRIGPETEVKEYEITEKGRAQLEGGAAQARELAILPKLKPGTSSATE